MDDAEYIQKLALVFMNSLDLDIEHGIDANLYTFQKNYETMQKSHNFDQSSQPTFIQPALIIYFLHNPEYLVNRQ